VRVGVRGLGAGFAQVIANDGMARFTVLGPEVIRMEYSHHGSFDNRQSL